MEWKGRLMNDDATKDDEPTLGLRCAWCGKILREPVGFANPMTLCVDARNLSRLRETF
jgi:hypothetical protein